MIFAGAALLLLIQTVQSGVVSSGPALAATPSRLVATQAAAPVVAPAPAKLVAPVAAAGLVSAPAPLAAAPLVAASAPLAAAPLVAASAPLVTASAPLAAAPLFAASAPLAAYARTVPQAVAPFASSVNYVSKGSLLPYVARTPVVSPLVETFSAPLVAGKLTSVASAPLVAAPTQFYSTFV